MKGNIMNVITCSSCGFTANEIYFVVEATEQGLGAVTYEAECQECGNWTSLGWDYAVSLYN